MTNTTKQPTGTTKTLLASILQAKKQVT